MVVFLCYWLLKGDFIVNTSYQSAMYIDFFQVIALIPCGKVATYGQIAKMAGWPKHARHVGFALKNLDGQSDLPWYRVINSQGKIRLMKENEQGENIQIIKLQEEGIVVLNGKINLKQYLWDINK